MTTKLPDVGDILNYNFLWNAEYQKGKIAGAKARPSLVIGVTESPSGKLNVHLVPITHTKPHNAHDACKLSAAAARQAGLDNEENFVILTEINSFEWKGYDVEPVLFSSPPDVYYGRLDLDSLNQVRSEIRAKIKRKKISVVQR